MTLDAAATSPPWPRCSSTRRTATVANTGPSHGKRVKLALTDPDSNAVVPAFAPRFAGEFMVTSQADQQQIFVQRTDGRRAELQVLNLSQAVDDTAWAALRTELLFATDATADTVDAVTGAVRHRASVIIAVTPCDAGDAPATCPGARLPAELPRLAEPADRPCQPPRADRPAPGAQGPDVHRPARRNGAAPSRGHLPGTRLSRRAAYGSAHPLEALRVGVQALGSVFGDQ